MKKVYCLMCRYHGRHIDGSSKCFNNKNITNRRYKDTYLMREEDFDYISSPEKINKNNDCRWYKSVID